MYWTGLDLDWTWTGPGLEQTVCVVLYVLRYVLGVLDLDWTRTGADCVCCIICFMLCVRCTGLYLDMPGLGLDWGLVLAFHAVRLFIFGENRRT